MAFLKNTSEHTDESPDACRASALQNGRFVGRRLGHQPLISPLGSSKFSSSDFRRTLSKQEKCGLLGRWKLGFISRVRAVSSRYLNITPFAKIPCSAEGK